jgi:hypothetical protein
MIASLDHRLKPDVKRFLLFTALALVGLSAFAAVPSQENRKESLAEILRLLPKNEPWEKWLAATGTLPPDFDSLPSTPFLPDPLRFHNGKEVKRDDWPRRRQELLALFQYYVTGSWPASPGNTRVAELKEREQPAALSRILF